MRFETSTENWPLFIVVTPTTFELDDTEAFITNVNSSVYARRERFATLVLTHETETMPGAAARRRLADWQNETIEHIRAYNVYTATVISSPLIRGALTAMHWVFRPPNAQDAFPSVGEAFDACIDRLRKDGVPFNDSLTRLVASNPHTPGEILARRTTLRPQERV